MRNTIAALAILAVVVAVSCRAAEEKKEEPKKEEAKPAAAAEGNYELIDTQALKFRLQGQGNYGDARDDDGIKPAGGTVGTLTCEGTKLELANPAFEDGFVVTKDYGKIKVRFTTTMIGVVLNVYLTPDQKAKLSKLRK